MLDCHDWMRIDGNRCKDGEVEVSGSAKNGETQKRNEAGMGK